MSSCWQTSSEPGFSFTLECITIPFISRSLSLLLPGQQTVPDAHFSGLIFLTPSPTGMTCPCPAPSPTPIDRPPSTYFIQENIEISNSGREREAGQNEEEERGRSRQGQRQHLSRDEVNLLIYQATGQPVRLAGLRSCFTLGLYVYAGPDGTKSTK